MSVFLLKNYPFVFAFCLLLAACNAESPVIPTSTNEKFEISEEEMVNILTDVHIAEGLIQVSEGSIKDSVANANYQKIYKHYSIDEEKFDESLKQYLRNPVLADKVYKQVLENLTKLEAKPDPKAKGMKQSIETINSKK